jgi:hypothetical protein
MPSSDSPLPASANVARGARIALLQLLSEARRDGRIGTPQQRLTALRAKAKSARLLERLRALPLAELVTVHLRLIRGEDPQVILSDDDATVNARIR